MLRGLVLGIVLTVLVIFAGIQLVPFGRRHTNPPARQEPAWDSPRTRELAVRACYDCHSNETEWPWYSNVAPISWVMQIDVTNGRADLNFSRWDQPQREARNMAHEVQEGDMPPAYYPLVHPGAHLTQAERDELVRGLQATFAASPPPATAATGAGETRGRDE